MTAGTFEYDGGDTASCVNCTAGKYTGTTGMGECELCSIGQYAAEDRATSCAYCESPLSSYEGSAECKVTCHLFRCTFRVSHFAVPPGLHQEVLLSPKQ